MNKNYQVGEFFLDDFQMELLNNEENTIVIAGAGSGKTLTIVGKINYLLENKIVTPEEILVISFTNASVNDLKKKITSNINIYTFHKLAMMILDKSNYTYTICNPNTLNYLILEELRIMSKIKQKIILKYLNYPYKYSRFLESNEFLSFAKFIETFINLWQTNDSKKENISLHKFKKLEKQILTIIFEIYLKYLYEKQSTQTCDFDDLILTATKMVKDANLHFKYIIIDEFQDTSLIRLNLIKEIIKYTNALIIVVGDDWQSIYRFSGCDISLFINFPKFFSDVKTIKLVNTYRNSTELISLASTFILKNPYQITKNLAAFKTNATPLIFCPYQNKVSSFKKVINHLSNISNDIMVLGRNNKDIYPYLDATFNFDGSIIHYQNKEIKYFTVHRSKRLEAEYVIVLNCNNETLGFPNKIENNPLINKLYPDNEIPYAEERRLFYVAITRCKESTYLLYEKSNPSPFIKEIKRITKNKLGTIPYFK